jgi:ubiquinone/menaquinone biosynthesis C-methylase UbiE
MWAPVQAFSTELFLRNGNKVFAVEPNKEMREAAESIYLKEPGYFSINGTAQQTNLPEHTIDIIFCAQAFHWFNTKDTKTEFNRILKSNGHLVLVWNVRKEQDEFQRGYESILKKIPEYNEVTHKNVSDKEIINFFSPKIMHKKNIANFQAFNINGLKGRLKSSSYCPKVGTAYQNLMGEIDTLFHKFENNGIVKFEYDTNIYWY